MNFSSEVSRAGEATDVFGASLTAYRVKSRMIGIAVMTTALAFVITAGLLFGPRVLRSVGVEVVEGDTPVTVTAAGATAEIPLPLGWSYRPTLWDESRVTLHSPDGRMSIELQLSHDVDPAAAARTASGKLIDAFETEPLGDATLLHARIDDGALAGALAHGTDVLTFISTASPAYDAALATVLSSIRFTP